jgi:hypothetical protein
MSKEQYKRRPDWRTRLYDYVVSRQGVPFKWGDFDCAKFAADAVEAMTGKDPMKGMRAYKSEEGARKLLKDKGYKSHGDLLSELFEEIPVALGQPGDIAVMENDGLGVVQGQYVYQPGDRGIALSEVTMAKRMFRVPE